MPELPEVETVARDLRPLLVGKIISEVWWSGKKLRLPWVGDWGGQLSGYRFSGVTRRAKWLVFSLDKEEKEKRLSRLYLVGHLGMTGQLTFQTGPTGAFSNQDHVHLEFKLQNKTSGQSEARKVAKNPGKKVEEGTLRFRDIRRFGGFQLVRAEGGLDVFFQDHQVGPEPWDCNPEQWYEALHKTRRFIKAILLDQTVIAGVGNIYADECLHASGIHPLRRGVSLSKVEAARVLNQAATVMREAIRHRGTTIRNYVGGENLEGANQGNLRVYGREGEACRTCGGVILRIVVGGRSSHFCPRCQKPEKIGPGNNPGRST